MVTTTQEMFDCALKTAYDDEREGDYVLKFRNAVPTVPHPYRKKKRQGVIAQECAAAFGGIDRSNAPPGPPAPSPTIEQLLEAMTKLLPKSRPPPRTVPVSPEVYKQLMDLYYNPRVVVGKPPGVESGTALREYKDMSERKWGRYQPIRLNAIGLEVKADPRMPVGQIRLEVSSNATMKVEGFHVETGWIPMDGGNEPMEAQRSDPDAFKPVEPTFNHTACAWCGASFVSGHISWRAAFSCHRPGGRALLGDITAHDHVHHVADFCDRHCARQARGMTAQQVADHQRMVIAPLQIAAREMKERVRLQEQLCYDAVTGEEAMAIRGKVQERDAIIAELKRELVHMTQNRDVAAGIIAELQKSSRGWPSLWPDSKPHHEGERMTTVKDGREESWHAAWVGDGLRWVPVPTVDQPIPSKEMTTAEKIARAWAEKDRPFSGSVAVAHGPPAYVAPGRVRALPVMRGGPIAPSPRPAVLHCQGDWEVDDD